MPDVRFTNLDKVYWPEPGLTKGWMVEWYRTVGPHLLAWAGGHPVTLHRAPDGVEGVHWFETRAPAHPPWVRTVTFSMPRSGKVFDVAVLDELDSLLWAAQAGSIEIHPFLAPADDLARPDVVVFDLDPGPPAGPLECARVAAWLREVLDALGLASFPKTSGGLGLHVFVPVTGATYDDTKAFARAVAGLLVREHPELVVDRMAKSLRGGKVFVDWGQNDPGRSTVAPWSLRGHRWPTVSCPLPWDELGAVTDAHQLVLGPDAALTRLGADPWAGAERQTLPASSAD